MFWFSQRLVNIGIYLATLVGLVDQGSKWFVLNRVMESQPQIIEVTSFFNLVLSWNRGITFGMFNGDYVWAPYVFAIAAAVIGLVLLWWLYRSTSLLEAIAIGFVIGGAVGNLIDRFRFGAVMDFLDFHAWGYHWYAFNIADSAIVCGVALMLWDQFRLRKQIKQ